MAHIKLINLGRKQSQPKCFVKSLSGPIWHILPTYCLWVYIHWNTFLGEGYTPYTFFFSGQKWWTRFILHYGVLVSYKSKVKVFEVNFWIVCPWPNIDLAQYLPKYPNVCRQGVCHDLQLSSKIYKHIQVHIGFL